MESRVVMSESDDWEEQEQYTCAEDTRHVAWVTAMVCAIILILNAGSIDEYFRYSFKDEYVKSRGEILYSTFKGVN